MLGPIVNVPPLVTVPADVVTEILPVVAPLGTVVLIRVVLADGDPVVADDTV